MITVYRGYEIIEESWERRTYVYELGSGDDVKAIYVATNQEDLDRFIDANPARPKQAPFDSTAAAAQARDIYAVGQEVILLDGTSLIGRVIEKGYKVSLGSGEGRWYTADELAVYVKAAQDTASE